MLSTAEEVPRMLFPSTMKSPLVGVSDAAWQRFVRALEIQPIGAVSPSGGFGSYDLRPQALADLGYVGELRRARTPAGRLIYECTFKLPWTRDRFLRDPLLQLQALGASMARYHDQLATGKIYQPEGVSRAGALAILHVGRPAALAGWPHLFPHTRARFVAARGAF